MEVDDYEYTQGYLVFRVAYNKTSKGLRSTDRKLNMHSHSLGSGHLLGQWIATLKQPAVAILLGNATLVSLA
jgi:hypothetical protein